MRQCVIKDKVGLVVVYYVWRQWIARLIYFFDSPQKNHFGMVYLICCIYTQIITTLLWLIVFETGLLNIKHLDHFQYTLGFRPK